MTDVENVRNSNFELLRIISMLFIIIFHLIMHLCSIHSYEMSPFIYILLRFILAITLVHVSSFVIVTGYFQCKKKMRLSKVISINNATWFYSVVFLVIALILTRHFNVDLAYPITNLDIFKTLIPLDYGLYWYIGCYLVLYLISPILNIVIDNCDKKTLLRIIIGLFIIFSIIPTLTLDATVYTKEGHSVANFILLYFIGAYLRNYPISKSAILSKITDKGKQLLYFIGFIGLAFCSVLFFAMSEQLGGVSSSEIVNYIADVFFWFFNSFGSPILIIQTIFYFLFFSTLNIKSKVINFISSCTLGIYLVHENIYVRDNLYGFLEYFNVSNMTLKTIVLILLTAIAIFIISMIIEILRQKLFAFIYKRKISGKFRKWYRSYFKKLGFDINW